MGERQLLHQAVPALNVTIIQCGKNLHIRVVQHGFDCSALAGVRRLRHEAGETNNAANHILKQHVGVFENLLMVVVARLCARELYAENQ